jgi:glycosyltransferase involved in cell wall biosynthesis
VRIAWVVTGGFDRSGRERVTPSLLTTIERLSRRHQVDVFVLRYADVADTYGLVGATIHDLGRPSGLRRQHRALMRALRAAGPFDVLHAYLAIPAGIVSVVAGHRLRIPVVVTLTSGEFVSIPSLDYGLQRRIATRIAVRVTMGLASRVLVETEYMTALARAHGGDPQRLPLGVDASRFPFRERPDGPPWRLLNVASLNRVKDHPTLLEALRILIDRHLDVHLDIVGEDTLGGSVQMFARRLGVEHHVTFHGLQPIEALPGFYDRAHLMVQSSRHEGAGVAVLEAATSGLPIVGTSVGYVADWAPGRAIAVPPADPAALAAAVADALAHPGRRREIASAAHDWAVAHDADWTTRQLDEVYEAVRRPSAGG